jgi:hypothetical protein
MSFVSGRSVAAGAAALVFLSALATLSCRRSDIRTDEIVVPNMVGERDVRIVTNAVLDATSELAQAIRNDCEIDRSKRRVLYHEGPRLRLPAYRALLVARLREVGFNQARILRTGLNPPPLVDTVDGPCQDWPQRHTAVMSVPGMNDVTAANRVVDALAYARAGRDDPRVCLDPASRTLTVVHEGLRAARSNLEHAIACAGYAANAVPARLGGPDSAPDHWRPL